MKTSTVLQGICNSWYILGLFAVVLQVHCYKMFLIMQYNSLWGTIAVKFQASYLRFMSSPAVCLDHIQYVCMWGCICVTGNSLIFHWWFQLFYGLTHSWSHEDQHTPLHGLRVQSGIIATRIHKQIYPVAHRKYACLQECVSSCVDWIA